LPKDIQSDFITVEYHFMKTIVTMTIVVVVGVLLTSGISLARLGAPQAWSSLSLDLPAETDVGSPASPGPAVAKTSEPGSKPLAVIEKEEFDFGHLRNKSMDNQHIFKVRNAGTAILEFTGSSVSCTKCTFVELKQKTIAPGETGDVLVSWNVDTIEDHFRQSVKVMTNDPDHPELRFVVTGKVVRPLAVEPQKVVFSNVHVGESAEAKLRLLAYFSDHLELSEQKFMEEATAQYFAVSMATLTKDQLDKQAESGVEVTVTAKPGLPVGAINQTLKMKTNLAEEPELTVAISGEVTGAVTVHHKDWDKEFGYLKVGHVKQSEGAKLPLNLIARGSDLSGLALEPPEIDDPEAVKVTYGKITEMKAGTVFRIPVTIEIPPGSPLVNHMGGSTAAKWATILIPTNKPALGRVKLSVRFAVIADE
jgi:hypothetical protein